jgi:hypothetical protein
MSAVATDVASRGIDVKGVTHVINYDMPKVRLELVINLFVFLTCAPLCRTLKITHIASGVLVAPA